MFPNQVCAQASVVSPRHAPSELLEQGMRFRRTGPRFCDIGDVVLVQPKFLKVAARVESMLSSNLRQLFVGLVAVC